MEGLKITHLSAITCKKRKKLCGFLYVWEQRYADWKRFTILIALDSGPRSLFGNNDLLLRIHFHGTLNFEFYKLFLKKSFPDGLKNRVQIISWVNMGTGLLCSSHEAKKFRYFFDKMCSQVPILFAWSGSPSLEAHFGCAVRSGITISGFNCILKNLSAEKKESAV